jgi:ferric-chelate reductase
MLCPAHRVIPVVLSIIAAAESATGATNACDAVNFSAIPALSLGSDMKLRSLVVGENVCFEVSLKSAQAKWVSISLAKEPFAMCGSNAVVFDSVKNTVVLYDLIGYKTSEIVPSALQSIVVKAMSVSDNGMSSFTFQRSLAATSVLDAALATNSVANLNWGYGTTVWPSYHVKKGSNTVKLTLSDASSSFDDGNGEDGAATTSSTFVSTYTVYIVAITFTMMMLLGLVATYIGPSWRLVHNPPLECTKSSTTRGSFCCHIIESIVDFKVGECVVVFIYLASLLVVAMSVQSQFSKANVSSFSRSRLPVLITGHVGLASLMFLMLPVARGKHWEIIFGISPERILKFHRSLGRLCILLVVLHLVLLLEQGLVSITSTAAYGTQQVLPLYGFLACLVFFSMGLLAIDPIRRRCYELFYFYHRIASILGLVFVMLHSSTIQTAMIFPLAVYGLSGVLRCQAFFNIYHALVDVNGSLACINFVLPTSPQTQKWTQEMNPCSFFWVCVPAVSYLEWHPFSAIVSPDGQTIGFSMKSLTRQSFVDRVIQHATASTSMTHMKVLVGGPYGKPTVNVEAYHHVVLIGGGIGITPLLSLVNQSRWRPSMARLKIQLHWVVQTPAELLVCDRWMFPLPENVCVRLYVTKATASGSIHTSSGETVPYVNKRPVMEEIVNVEQLVSGESVCVIACGPPTLVRDAQCQARACSLDFHKEVFIF